MPESIRCLECNAAVLGYKLTAADPRPIGRDDCPHCGGTEFITVDDTRDTVTEE